MKQDNPIFVLAALGALVWIAVLGVGWRMEYNRCNQALEHLKKEKVASERGRRLCAEWDEWANGHRYAQPAKGAKP